MHQHPFGFNYPYGVSPLFKDDTPYYGKPLFFSVGDTGDYQTKDSNGDLFISIRAGIAHFSFPQVNPNLGIGDKVSFDGVYCLISEKIDQSNWYVTNTVGTPFIDIDIVPVTSITKVFNSLNAAIGGDSPELADYISYNLTGFDIQPNIICYSIQETNNILFKQKWTIDPSRYIKIYTPSSSAYECNSRQRHLGVLGNGYKLQATSIYDEALIVEQHNVEIKGLQITNASNGLHLTGTNINVINNIVANCGGVGISDWNTTGTLNHYIGNTIYSCTACGISVSNVLIPANNKISYLYNNTVVGCGIGVQLGSPDPKVQIYIKNQLCNWNETDYVIVGGTEIYGYNCVSRDNTVLNIPHIETSCFPASLVKFKDRSNNDYHLNTGDDGAIISGLNLSHDPYYSFNTDIDGDLIGDPWSIGSDYTAHKVVFSVGSTTDYIGPATITISDGIATFSVAQTGDAFGVGHLVTYNTSDTCYLIEKISTSKYRVALANGTAPADIIESAIVSVTPAFASLNAALDGSTSGIYTALGNTEDLVSLNLQIDVACYNISDSLALTTSDTWITDEIRNFKIYVPTDTVTQCNTIQKFAGKLGDGYQLQGNLEISIPYTKVDGIQNTFGSIKMLNAPNSMVLNCLSANPTTGILFESSFPGINVIANNLIYDGSGEGILIHCLETNINDTYYCYNNNTIKCTKGISFDTPVNTYSNIVVVKNHISQFNDDDYYIANQDSGRMIISNSVSSDATANKFENKTNTINKSLEFIDYINKDFHLSISDAFTINPGEDLSYNAQYPFSVDFDNEVRAPGYWNVGVDNFTNTCRNEVFYSIGAYQGFLQSFNSHITILNGIAYFDNAQSCAQLGIGDCITYNTSVKCYLAEKVNYYLWRVVTVFGAKPSDITLSPIVNIKRTFNTLKGAVDGASGVNFLNTTDLTSLGVHLNLVCYDDGVIDGDAITVSGWTTNVNNQIKIYTAWNTKTQSNKKNEHNGKWGNGYSLLVPDSDAVTIHNAWTTVQGLQIDGSNKNNGNKGISFDTSAGIVIKNNIIKNCESGIIRVDGVSLPVDDVIGNVIYDCKNGIHAVYCNVYNNTVIDCTVLGYSVGTDSVITNNIAQGSATNFNDGSIVTYCISSDGTATGTNCHTQTLDFIDKFNNDYHLSNSIHDAVALGHGLNLSSSFIRDINNNLIEDWSIGADCPLVTPLVTTTPAPIVHYKVYYSIGTNINDNQSGSGTNTISISSGIATFSVPQTSDSAPKIGVGDVVTYQNGLQCHLKEKISNTQWVVVNRYGISPDNIEHSLVNSIKRTFNSLYLAMNYGHESVYAMLGTKDLSGNNYQLNLPCYNDNPDFGSVMIAGWSTSSDYCINIYTPQNINTECNKSQRHKGKWNTNNSGQSTNPGGYNIIGTYNDALQINTVDYVKIEGIQAQSTSGDGNGIHLVNCNWNTVIANIAYGCSNDGICNESPYGMGNTFNHIVNNLCDSNFVGIHDIGTNYTSANNTSCIYNNTLVNNFRKGFLVELGGAYTSHVINSKNNMLQYNRGGAVQHIGTDTLNLLRCLSNDYTVTLPTSVECIPDQLIYFLDTNDKVYTLDPSRDQRAIGSGVDLSTDPDFSFSTDIAGRLRNPGYWNIGAFEYIPILGSGELITEVMTMRGYAISQKEFPPSILYLRKTVDRPNTFTSMDTLSAFLRQEIFGSYAIYIQGNEEFSGTVDFGARLGTGTQSKTITMQTDPSEQSDGPAILIALSNDGSAGAPLISDGSEQAKITFLNMKLRMSDSYYDEVFIKDTAHTSHIVIENCIVQLNNDTIVGNLPCKVEVINSQLIYRNTSGTTILYISKNTTNPNVIENTNIITYTESDIDFSTENSDSVYNCLLWNFSSFNQVFSNPNVINCISDKDPLFIEGQIISLNFIIAEVMRHTFMPQYLSPCRNAGYLDPDYSISTDILGRPRISEDTIDIGPYELSVFIAEFDVSQIRDVYQDKLFYNSNSEVFTTLKRQKIYRYLPQKFALNISTCNEFARESKIFIELKPYTKSYSLFSDKNNISLIQLEAYYDNEQNTIVVKKIPQLIGNLFNKIFETGQYSFIFNERENLLHIYILNTYDKGMSGQRSIVNNARFGGSSMTSI